MKIYGKNPVIERIKADPKSVKRVYVEIGHPDHSYISSKMKKYGVPVMGVPASKMLKLGRSLNTQGLLIEVEDFTYADYDDLVDEAYAQGITLLFIDGVTDPQNMGASIRTAACLGGLALDIPTHGTVEINDTVTRVACGGENHLKVSKVNNLNNAIEKAKAKGFWIAGSVVKDGDDLTRTKLPLPLGLVIGSEGKGIREVTLKHIDVKLSIPMARERLSLNVAHATALFCYEIKKQKEQKPQSR